MTLFVGALVTLLGGLVAEAYRLARSLNPLVPWRTEGSRMTRGSYFLGVVLRLIMALGLGVAYVGFHQITAGIGAFTLGLTAPDIVKNLVEGSSAVMEPPS